MTSRTTKSTRNGKLAGKPLSQLTLRTYLVEMSAPMAMTIPPRNVNGMLEKYPMAAAPNAWTTSRVRVRALSPTNGTSRTPERAAKVDPISQATRRTRVGLIACIDTSSASSTTARMDNPLRVNANNAYRAIIPPTAMTVTHSCGYCTLTPATRKLCDALGRYWLTGIVSDPYLMVARPCTSRMMPTVPTIFVETV